MNLPELRNVSVNLFLYFALMITARKGRNNNFIISVVMYYTSTCKRIIIFIYLYITVEVSKVCKVIRIFSRDKFEMLLCQDGSVNFNLRILESVL
jgi:hypothetical protein